MAAALAMESESHRALPTPPEAKPLAAKKSKLHERISAHEIYRAGYFFLPLPDLETIFFLTTFLTGLHPHVLHIIISPPYL